MLLLLLWWWWWRFLSCKYLTCFANVFKDIIFLAGPTTYERKHVFSTGYFKIMSIKYNSYNLYLSTLFSLNHDHHNFLSFPTNPVSNRQEVSINVFFSLNCGKQIYPSLVFQ